MECFYWRVQWKWLKEVLRRCSRWWFWSCRFHRAGPILPPYSLMSAFPSRMPSQCFCRPCFHYLQFNIGIAGMPILKCRSSLLPNSTTESLSSHLHQMWYIKSQANINEIKAHNITVQATQENHEGEIWPPLRSTGPSTSSTFAEEEHKLPADWWEKLWRDVIDRPTLFGMIKGPAFSLRLDAWAKKRRFVGL